MDLAKSRGASYFDIGKAWDRLSRSQKASADFHFLDLAIGRRDTIVLATPGPAIRQPSMLAEEIKYLTARDYSWLDDLTLVPR